MMRHNALRYFDLATVGDVTGCRFQEEERLLGYSIVEFFGVFSIVPANRYDLPLLDKWVISIAFCHTFLPVLANEAIFNAACAGGGKKLTTEGESS